MATEQKDFKVKKGIIVGGNIAHSTNGFLFDSTANTLSVGGTSVALQTSVDLVQDNVATNATSIQNGVANTYNTYTTLAARDDLVQDNVASLNTTVTNLSGSVDTVQDNVATNATNISTLDGDIDTVQDNVAANATRLDSLQYYRTFTANGVNVSASSNADTLTFSAGDGITLIGNAGTDTIEIHVDGSTDIGTVSDNVDIVSSNVDNVIDGTTPFTGDVTMQQNLTVDGDLIVGGTTTSIDSTDTTIADRTIVLANGASAASFDVGLLLNRGSDSNVFVGFDESLDQFVAGYTTNEGGNVTSDFTIASYVNAHFNDIVVEGTVDGVDIATRDGELTTVQTDLPTISGNTVTNETRLDSLQYYRTIQVSGESDVVASANADTLTFVAGTGISLATAADQVTINSTTGSDIDTVQDNVATNATNINTVSSNVDLVQSNVSSLQSGATAFTGLDINGDATLDGGNLTFDSAFALESNSATGVGATETTLFSFEGATYRGAELTLMTQDITNSEYQINKMLIVHDGTDVHFAEYGAVHTGSDELATFNVAIDGSDVISIKSEGGSANKKITVAQHLLLQ